MMRASTDSCWSSSLLRGLRGTSSATDGRCCIAGGMRSATTVWRAAGTLVMSDDMDDESVGLEWTRCVRSAVVGRSPS